MTGATLYICYYHITDPLVRSQVVAYLAGLARLGLTVHLLTFERERLSGERQASIREELREQGIHWHCLRYHQRPSLPATLFDVMVGAWTAARLCRKFQVRLVHARSHVPGAMALWLKRWIGVPFIFDLRGLMAEEYADAGRWSPQDLKFQLTKRMERVLLREADAVVVLTQRIKADLMAPGAGLDQRAHEAQVIPCCVDMTHFVVTEAQREAYRASRGWGDRKVLMYVGKVGSWYRPDQMARFFRSLQEVAPGAYFQVLTQDNPAPLAACLAAEGVDPADFDIRFGAPQDLPLLLSAADAALSFRAGELSKRAASPTKVGECLAAGLPIVTISGIGDCDELLSRHQVGLVMTSFEDQEHRRAAQELRELLSDSALRSRCRRAAAMEFDLNEIGIARYAATYQGLLEPKMS
jgi:glycosyltransferase involved in cell wall biosynthesis